VSTQPLIDDEVDLLPEADPEVALDYFIDAFTSANGQYERWAEFARMVRDEQEANHMFGLSGISNETTQRIGLEAVLDLCHAIERARK